MSGLFDGARYEALLEGLEVSEIAFSRLTLGDRADAEYYSKENILIEHSLRDHDAEPLRNLCHLVASAFYPPAVELYETGDIPFARCVDCIDFPVITQSQSRAFARIPRWFLKEGRQIRQIKRGEIILTKVGSPCFASVNEEFEEIALSRTVLGLRQINDIDPYYLTAFLRCRYGFNQLMRERELTIQLQLTLERVREVLVFKPSSRLQAAVRGAMVAHARLISQASATAVEAENNLISALGLADWRPPEPLTYTRRASEAFAAGRIDAEYFAPRVEALRSHLRQDFDVIDVGELGEVTNGDPVKYSDEGAIPIIRSGDLSDISDVERFKKAETTEPIFHLRPDDVLVSSIGFGSIGKVQVFDHEGDFGTVSEVTVIRQSRFNPYYLTAFLRSHAGQMQIERFITGATGQLHLYPRDVKGIFVPALDEAKQKEFETLALTARSARRRARDLLDRAKRAVEIAIEESETAALAYLGET